MGAPPGGSTIGNSALKKRNSALASSVTRSPPPYTSAAAETSRRLRPHALHGAGFLVRVALFLPGIGVQVVAVDLPESGRVHLDELEAADPLRALPEVEVRHHQAAGASMFGSQRRPVVLDGKEHVVGAQVGER